jgi:hypothetical protein
MLDPNMADPDYCYSHAQDLMRILAEHDARTELADEGSPEPSDLEPT